MDAATEAVSLAYPDQHRRLQADEDVDTVRADEAALSQVVTNLLVNAAKYPPAGSRITASVASGPEGPRIAIVDACGGMSTETLRHICEWDFCGDRSSEQQQHGLGLGLCIARRLSERFGWDLSAENRDVVAPSRSSSRACPTSTRTPTRQASFGRGLSALRDAWRRSSATWLQGSLPR